MADRSIVIRIRAEVAQAKAALDSLAASASKVGASTQAAAAKADKATVALGTSATRTATATASAARATETASTRASTALGRIGTTAAANTQHIDRLGRGVAVFGSVVGLGLGLAVKSFADFDQAMSGVAAALPDATAQMGALRAEAIKLGADTQFSATEAAQGITALAKAGVSAQSILGGGLKGSLDLAAAGQLDVAQAAEIAASAMTQFKLSGQSVPHIADLLAAGAGKAQGTVSDLGQALNQTGLIAASTGLSIEETTGGLAAFASAGLIGSDAGTSFKTMLQRLVPQGAQAKAMFEKLGISAYDSSGQFVGLAKFAGQLKDSLSKLTPEARASALQIIFGTDAVRAANVLYEQGQSGIQGWIDKVNDAGFAADQTAKLQDNLIGDVKKLRSAFDSVFINSGSGSDDFLRGLTQKVDSAVTSFGHLPVAVQQSALGIVALGTGGLLAAAGVAKAVTAVTALRTALTESGIAARFAGTGYVTAAKGLGAIAAVTGVALVAVDIEQMIGASQTATVNIDALAKSLGQLRSGGELTGGIADLFRDKNGIFGDEKFVSAGEAIKRFSDLAKTALPSGFWNDVKRGFDGGVGSVGQFDKILRQVDDGLAKLVSSGHADDAAAALAKLTSGLSASEVSQVQGRLTSYNTALADTKAAADAAATSAASVGPAAVDGGAGAATGAVGITDLHDAAQAAADAAGNLDDALRGLGGGFRSERQAARDYRAALQDVKDSLGKDDQGKQKATSDERQRALDRLAQSTLDYSAAAEKSGKAAAFVSGIVAKGREDFIKQAEAMGLSAKQAKILADQEGLLPAEVRQQIVLSGVDDAKKKAAETKTALDAAAVERTANVKLNVLNAEHTRTAIQDLNDQLGKTPDRKSIDVAAPGAKGARTDVDNLNTAFSNAPKSVSVSVSVPGALDANTKVRTLNDTFAVQPTAKSTLVSVNGVEGSQAGVMGLQASIDALHGKTVAVHVATYYDNPFDADRTARARGLSSGGYTGDGGKYQPTKLIQTHGGEFVSTKETTSKWRSLFEWMHAGRDPRSYFGVPGYARGGFVPQTFASTPQSVRVNMPPGAGSITETTHAPIIIENFAGSIPEAEYLAQQRRSLAALGGGRRTR